MDARERRLSCAARRVTSNACEKDMAEFLKKVAAIMRERARLKAWAARRSLLRLFHQNPRHLHALASLPTLVAEPIKIYGISKARKCD